MQVQFLKKHEQALFCSLMDVQTGITNHMIVVYALNTNEQIKELWRFVRDKFSQTNYPMFMGGDFNDVLSCDDREQGNPMSLADVEDFQSCIQNSDYRKLELLEPNVLGRITKKWREGYGPT